MNPGIECAKAGGSASAAALSSTSAQAPVCRLAAVGRVLRVAALIAAVFVGSYALGPTLRAAYRAAFPVPEYTTGDFADLFATHATPVVMYATTDCSYCEQARVLFANEQVAYTELRIDESTQAEADFVQRGGRGVPLLYIGDRRIAGYREGAIREALDRLPSRKGVGLDRKQSP